MHKSTILLATLAICLTITTVFVVRLLIREADSAPKPQVEGTNVLLGIPADEKDRQQKAYESQSAILWNTTTHKIEFEQNGFERRPIASLTKIMTAMVALDYGMPWEQATAIEPREYVLGGSLLLHPGEEVTVRDLFNASLLGSANNATLAYIRQLNIPESEFVQAMNRKAVSIGLEQTSFVEVTGLDPDNISTAYEVARMSEYAFAHYPEIHNATAAPQYSFVIHGSGREHTIKNTNRLLADGTMSFQGSKTGYLYEAGYCLVTQGVGDYAHRIAVILGNPSENGQFSDIQNLLTRP